MSDGQIPPDAVQVDITKIPMPMELVVKQANMSFDYIGEKQFWFDLSMPIGIRIRVYFDEGGWEQMLNLKQGAKSGIVIAR